MDAAQPGWWFAGGWWFSKDWVFDAATTSVSQVIEMAFVGQAEAIHYAPQLVHVDAPVAEVLDGDEYGIRSDLGAYLSYLIVEASSRADQFHLSKTFDTHRHPCDRSFFKLSEVVANIDAANDALKPSFAPLAPAPLQISPIVKCNLSGDILTIASDGGDGTMANFSVGMTICVDQPGRGCVEVDIIATGTNSVQVSAPLDGAECFVTSVVVADPVRAVNVNEFARWRRNVRDTSNARPEFNDELYRLLYAPLDRRIASMTRSELYNDYLAHSGRIASVLDIVHMAQSAPTEILSKLTVRRGASLEFETDGAAVDGVTTLSSVATGESPGPQAEDRRVPTTAAVRELILEVARAPIAADDGVACVSRAQTSSRVAVATADTVVAKRVEADTMHVRGAMDVRDGEFAILSRLASANSMSVQRMECDWTASRFATVCDLAVERATADDINARDVSVANAVLSQRVQCNEAIVAGQDIAAQIARLARDVRDIRDRVDALV